jgi:LuxR family transcriptional regulator, maltose regulon positive regulatory protein
MVASAPKIAKSYHSVALPTHAAASAFRDVRRSGLAPVSTLNTLGSLVLAPYGCRRTIVEDSVTAAADGTVGASAASLQPVDVFVEAKLHPPTRRARWVERGRLVEALNEGAERRLTLIVAPAGYGKSTIVAQWLGQLIDRKVAWIALDAADNDPVRLWTHVAMALARAGCVIDDDVPGFVASHRKEILTTVLPRIINSLTAYHGRIVIVLEDFHFVRAGVCHEQVDFIIEYLPTFTGMVIITRADPSLRIGRLRVSTELAEIRADRLSFDAAEVSSLLAIDGIHLSDASVSELVGRTEGWPAGLYLATLSLVGRTDPDDFIHRLGGGDRFIGDYLIEEVLARQPSALRSFIIGSSLLERFCASLCDAVLGTSDSGSVLHDLERSNLFLVPLDDERKWFRFHHLFAAVARSELEAEDAERVRLLHTRAADWFAIRDFADDAIRHALAAGSPARASRLIQANWSRYVDAGRAATVQGWLEALRLCDPEAGPFSLVTAAWMAVLNGDEPLLSRLLHSLSEVTDRSALPDGTRSVESAVAIIRGMTGYEGPLRMMESSQLAVQLETDGNSQSFTLAQFALGHAHYVAGDLEAATSYLPKAAYSGSAAAITRSFALAVLAFVELERGNTERGRHYAEGSITLVEGPALRTTPQASMAFTAFGECQAATGQLAEAMSTLEEGLILRRKTPGLSPWPTIHHLLAMGRVLTAAGDLSRAQQMLAEAKQLMSRFPDGMGAMRERLAMARTALRRRSSPGAATGSLTDREADVLRLLEGSMSLSQIASELYLSHNTVKTHAQAVYRKLGVSSRSEAVRVGRRRSLF